MAGRYTLSVTYDEPNPAYDHSVSLFHRDYGVSERMNTKVLHVELTPEQWHQLRRDIVRAWEPAQDVSITQDKKASK